MVEHLLSKHGVLNAFNVAKNIRKSQLKSIRDSLKKLGVPKKNLEQKVDEYIIAETRKYLLKNKIPGLISNKKEETSPLNNIPQKIQQSLIFLANEIAKDCSELEYEKDHVIFLMQIIFHIYGITNDDMEEFKKKYKFNKDNEDGYLDNEGEN